MGPVCYTLNYLPILSVSLRHRCYLVTHAHLDHVNSLVLSAGSLAGAARRLYATHQTLKDIESIFSDRLWPNLASWDPKDDNAALIYTE